MINQLDLTHLSPNSIRVISDMHLECFRRDDIPQVIEKSIPVNPGDGQTILILAGDIHSKVEGLEILFNLIHHRFMHVVYVPGNHEFYGYEMAEWEKHVKEILEKFAIKNIACSFRDTIHIKLQNLQIIANTLWGDGGKSVIEEMDVQSALRDFYVIKDDYKRFTVRRMKELNRTFRKEIEECLSNRDFEKPVVVATHHMPSYNLCHPRFGNEINGGFACDMNLLLSKDELAPGLWIHGHTHDTIDGILWGTRIVCNPVGYPSEFLSPYNHFDGTKTIAVSDIKTKLGK